MLKRKKDGLPCCCLFQKQTKESPSLQKIVDISVGYVYYLALAQRKGFEPLLPLWG